MLIALRLSCVHLEASLCQGKVRPHTSCCLVARIPVSSPVHTHYRKEQYVRGMWEYFRRERDRVNWFREQAEEEKQAQIQGQWQLESPAQEYLEQAKRRDDTYRTENYEGKLHRPKKLKTGKNTKAFSGLK